MEGLGTIAFAILAFFVMVDWPEDAKFLTADEKALIAHRLANDGNSGIARMDTLNKDALNRIFRDWKIWCGLGTRIHLPLSHVNFRTELLSTSA